MYNICTYMHLARVSRLTVKLCKTMRLVVVSTLFTGKWANR